MLNGPGLPPTGMYQSMPANDSAAVALTPVTVPVIVTDTDERTSVAALSPLRDNGIETGDSDWRYEVVEDKVHPITALFPFQQR